MLPDSMPDLSQYTHLGWIFALMSPYQMLQVKLFPSCQSQKINLGKESQTEILTINTSGQVLSTGIPVPFH